MPKLKKHSKKDSPERLQYDQNELQDQNSNHNNNYFSNNIDPKRDSNKEKRNQKYKSFIDKFATEDQQSFNPTSIQPSREPSTRKKSKPKNQRKIQIKNKFFKQSDIDASDEYSQPIEQLDLDIKKKKSNLLSLNQSRMSFKVDECMKKYENRQSTGTDNNKIKKHLEDKLKDIQGIQQIDLVVDIPKALGGRMKTTEQALYLKNSQGDVIEEDNSRASISQSNGIKKNRKQYYSDLAKELKLKKVESFTSTKLKDAFKKSSLDQRDYINLKEQNTQSDISSVQQNQLPEKKSETIQYEGEFSNSISEINKSFNSKVLKKVDSIQELSVQISKKQQTISQIKRKKKRKLKKKESKSFASQFVEEEAEESDIQGQKKQDEYDTDQSEDSIDRDFVEKDEKLSKKQIGDIKRKYHSDLLKQQEKAVQEMKQRLKRRKQAKQQQDQQNRQRKLRMKQAKERINANERAAEYYYQYKDHLREEQPLEIEQQTKVEENMQRLKSELLGSKQEKKKNVKRSQIAPASFVEEKKEVKEIKKPRRTGLKAKVIVKK